MSEQTPQSDDFPDIFESLDDSADFDVADSDGQSLDALAQDHGSIEAASETDDIRDALDEVMYESGDGFPVFPVIVGTDGSWQEATVLNGSVVACGTGNDFRQYSATDTASGAALIQLAAGQGFAVEVEDVSSNGSFTRFYQISPAATSSIFLARITGYSGTFGAWIWNMTLLTGGTITAKNSFDWNGSSPGMLVGSPGSAGVIIGSTGQYNGTSCVIQPFGSQSGYIPVYVVGGEYFFDRAYFAQ